MNLDQSVQIITGPYTGKTGRIMGQEIKMIYQVALLTEDGKEYTVNVPASNCVPISEK